MDRLFENSDTEKIRKAAEQGDINAQFRLGLMYANGDGVPQNGAEAVKWFRKAAEQGYALAQFNLGYMYAKGQGVPQDYVEAVKWCRKAAEQGDAHSQCLLGGMYVEGRGVPQDYVEALKWFNLSAATGSADKDLHDLIPEMRDELAAKMTLAQIAEAQRQASEWKPKQQP